MKRKAVLLIVIILLAAIAGSGFGPLRVFAGTVDKTAGATDKTAEATDKTTEPETADVKEAFLRWRLTTNQNDRWTIYHAAMDEIMGTVLPTEADLESARQVINSYYSGISGIASEELIEKMALNRTPMRDDEFYLEYGASMEFVDVAFGEGRKDSFAAGLIYDFDARVIVKGWENYPKYPYTPDEEGYFHRTGQITEEYGMITNVHFSENR